MSIDINQVNSNRSGGATNNRLDTKVSNNTQTDNKSQTAAPETNSKDSVSLSSAAKNIAKIEAELKSSSVVDQNKVDAIKARLENGDYQINSQNMAQKMLDIEV